MKKLIIGSSAILLSSLFSPLAQANELEVDAKQQVLESKSNYSEKIKSLELLEPLESGYELMPDTEITPFAYDIGGGTNHYLYETINKTISIKQQNKTAAADALLVTASGMALGFLGYVKLATLTTIVGAKSSVETLFSGDSGAQFAINVKTYVYKSGSPTSTYWGYGLIVFSNAKTGKSLTTKKIIIGKTGWYIVCKNSILIF